MKRLAILLLALGLLVGMTGCGQKGYTLTGELTGFPDTTKVYIYDFDLQTYTDSADMINGRFVMKGEVEGPMQSVLFEVKDPNAKKRGGMRYVIIPLNNDKMEMKGDASDFPYDIRVTGGDILKDWNALEDLTSHLDKERNALLEEYMTWSREEQRERFNEIWKVKIHAIDSTNKALRDQFVKTHLNNSYFGVYQLDAQKGMMPRDTLAMLYDQLKPKYKASKFGQTIDLFLNTRILEVGDEAVEFTDVIDQHGNPFKLMDVEKRYILLDFSAAGCGPCITAAKEVPELLKIHGDSLEVITYSCDASKEVWEQTIKRDKMTWPTIWDGKGDVSRNYIQYGVRGYPTFVVIGPDRTIIDKWSGYGNGLFKNKFESLFREQAKKK